MGGGTDKDSVPLDDPRTTSLVDGGDGLGGRVDFGARSCERAKDGAGRRTLDVDRYILFQLPFDVLSIERVKSSVALTMAASDPESR